jgi:purine nucleosidase
LRSLVRRLVAPAIVMVLAVPLTMPAQSVPPRQKVIIDTDIGDDIDDAFALALALSSPELQILGVTAAWGDTQVRARVADRMLCDTGMESIPIAAGVSTESKMVLDHAPFARSFSKPVRQYPPAADLILDQIALSPLGQADAHPL